MGQVNFGSGRLRISRFSIQYDSHTKISNCVKNFGSSIVRFELNRILGPLSSERTSNVGLSMGSNRSIQILDLESVLSNLFAICVTQN